MSKNQHDISTLSELIIMGEGDYRISFIKKTLLATPPGELAQIIMRVDEHYFKTMVYYFQLFRTLEELGAIYNHKDFTVEAMEKVILYLYSRLLINDEDTDNLFPVYFPHMNQDKYLSLLIESEHIKRDHGICMNIIANLDKRHLDGYFSQRENLGLLLSLLKHYTDKEQINFFTRNTVLYDYLKRYLSSGEIADREVWKVLVDCEKQVNAAKHLDSFVEQLNGAEEKSSNINPRRVKAIINSVRESEDINQKLELLESKGMFQDESEKVIVTNILTNPQFAYILDSIPDFTLEELEYFQGTSIVFF